MFVRPSVSRRFSPVLLAASIAFGAAVVSSPASARAETTAVVEAMPAASPDTPSPDAAAPRDDGPDKKAAGDLPRTTPAGLVAGAQQVNSYWGYRLVSLLGMGVFVWLLYALSTNRRAVPWRLVGVGLGLQFALGLLVLKTRPGLWIFERGNDAFVAVVGYTEQGARFVFGNLTQWAQPVSGGAGAVEFGAVIGFQVLPVIVFFSSLMAVLYHLGVMQRVVAGMAWLMQRLLGVSGAESLSASANVFVGMTEAPLMVKPYIERMTMSELMAVMTGGFATVAGSVMAAYIGMLKGYFPDIGVHLLSASVMSAPASLVCAKLLLPETAVPETAAASARIFVKSEDVNLLDAAARGAGEGLKLAATVGAMLVAFVSLVAMADGVLGAAGGLVGIEGLTFERIGGYLFAPFALLMGVPPGECIAAGELLSVKTVLNEFVAYASLAGKLAHGGDGLSPRTVLILSYAMCGFANFGSIAIQLGGIGGMAPSRRRDLARLGLRAMLGGTIAAFLTANVAGILL